MPTVVKAANQVTITDITDAYSVMLSSEAYTFVGDASGVTSGSCTTNVIVMRGGTILSSGYSIGNPSYSKNNVITATAGAISSSTTVTISINPGAVLDETIVVTLPITVDGATINKKFTVSVALAGTDGQDGQDGQDGADGADAIYITIETDKGVVFKNNSGDTTMTPTVYVGGTAATIGQDSSTAGEFPVTFGGVSIGILRWYCGSTLLTSSNTGSASGKKGEFVSSSPWGRLKVTAAQVTNAQPYTCKLETSS